MKRIAQCVWKLQRVITCVVSSTTLTANEPFKQTVMMIIKYDDDTETGKRRVQFSVSILGCAENIKGLNFMV